MNITKHSPINNFLEDLFNMSISDVVGSDFINNQPAVNIYKNDEAYRIDLAAPGLEKSDFVINIEKRHLKIKVEKIVDKDAEKPNYKRREFSYSNFERSFKLPEQFDPSKIDAAYENGILTLSLGLKEKALEISKKIEIQ